MDWTRLHRGILDAMARCWRRRSAGDEACAAARRAEAAADRAEAALEAIMRQGLAEYMGGVWDNTGVPRVGQHGPTPTTTGGARDGWRRYIEDDLETLD